LVQPVLEAGSHLLIIFLSLAVYVVHRGVSQGLGVFPEISLRKGSDSTLSSQLDCIFFELGREVEVLLLHFHKREPSPVFVFGFSTSTQTDIVVKLGEEQSLRAVKGAVVPIVKVMLPCRVCQVQCQA
jgi:hypothetical protein